MRDFSLEIQIIDIYICMLNSVFVNSRPIFSTFILLRNALFPANTARNICTRTHAIQLRERSVECREWCPINWYTTWLDPVRDWMLWLSQRPVSNDDSFVHSACVKRYHKPAGRNRRKFRGLGHDRQISTGRRTRHMDLYRPAVQDRNCLWYHSISDWYIFVTAGAQVRDSVCVTARAGARWIRSPESRLSNRIGCRTSHPQHGFNDVWPRLLCTDARSINDRCAAVDCSEQIFDTSTGYVTSPRGTCGDQNCRQSCSLNRNLENRHRSIARTSN